MRQTANDNAHLFENEIEAIETAVSRAPDLDLTFAQVFPLKQLTNPTAEVSKYHVADDDEGAAELLNKLSDYPKIRISGSEATTTIYQAGVAFEIPLVDVKNSRNFGRPLDVEYAERAKRATDEKLNKLAYVGDTKFGVPGVLELSGVSTYSGTDWDTASLNIADEMTNAVHAIPRKFRGREYTMVLADQEYKKSQAIGNTNTNQTWLEVFQRNHPNVTVVVEGELDAGTLLSAGGTVASGTALLIPKDRNLVRMPVGYLPRAVMRSDVDIEFSEKVEGKVKARVGSVEAPHPSSIVLVTGWD